MHCMLNARLEDRHQRRMHAQGFIIDLTESLNTGLVSHNSRPATGFPPSLGFLNASIHGTLSVILVFLLVLLSFRSM